MQLSELIKYDLTTDHMSIPKLSVGLPCSDSRAIQPDDVFFAVPGNSQNGTDFVVDAVKGGASAIVCAQGTSIQTHVPVIHVNNVRRALAYAAAQSVNHPTSAFYLSGITGTNGKTTTTYILEAFWRDQLSGVIGTVNVRYAGQIHPASHTTPDPIQLHRLFSEMKSSQVKRVAMEVSSHALDQYRCDFCDFDSAVFTNLTQDHLDYHQTMDNYFKAKAILFERILRDSSKRNKLAVVNIDDAYGVSLAQSLRRDDIPYQTFSTSDPKADLHVLLSSDSISGLKAKLGGVFGQIDIETNLIGEHNIRNIMGAMLVAHHSGVKLDVMQKALQSVAVPGRLDRVGKSRFFVDYAHTPDALENVLSAVRKIMRAENSSGRLIAVFGCGGDRDRTKRPLMGAIAAKLADVALVTSDNPRTENPEKIVEDILPGVLNHKKPFDGKSGYVVVVDRKSALKKSVEIAGPEDVIVVAGKGHEDYQIIGKEKFHFDDKEILAEFLGDQ